MRAVVICILLSAVAISADLQSDIEDVVSQLPMKEIQSIGKQYVANYPSYAESFRHVEEVTNEELTKDFLYTEEGKQFMDYFKDRDIDAKDIFVYMTDMITTINHKWLEPMQESDLNGPGISGNFMDDYMEALQTTGFLDVVHRKMEVSPEFAKFVAALEEPTFKTLLYQSANSRGIGGFGQHAEVRSWKKFWNVLKKVFKVVVTVVKVVKFVKFVG